MAFANAVLNWIKHTRDAAREFRRLAISTVEDAWTRAKTKTMLVQRRRDELLELIVKDPSKARELVDALEDPSLPVHIQIYAAQIVMRASAKGVDLSVYIPEIETFYINGNIHLEARVFLGAALRGEDRE